MKSPLANAGLVARLAIVTVAAWAAPLTARGQTAPSAGLETLSDEALYADLARRGLTVLLERAFEQNHVPEAKRQAIRSLSAGGLAAAPAQAARGEGGGQTTRSVDAAIATEQDPKVLFDQGNQLITSAVTPALNLVEYWGETTQGMAKLRTVAEPAAKLLARAVELANARVNAEAKKLDANPNNQAAIDACTKAQDLATQADFTRRMNDYAVVISLDPANPNRARLADETIEALSQYDAAPIVRLAKGKLQRAKGAYDEAVATLDTLTAADAKFDPAPTQAQLYEARYFGAMAAMQAGRLDEATRRLAETDAWARASLPPQSQRGTDAASLLLKYRIDVAGKHDDRARDDLLSLLKAHPERENQILDQFASRVSDAADVHTMDVLTLKAVLRRADGERERPEGQAADAKVIERGIAAGQELIARKGAAGISDAMLDDAYVHVALLLQKNGKKLEEANLLLDYLDALGASAVNGKLAMDEALRVLSDLRDENPEDAAAGKAFDRALAIAVNPPFSRKDLSYNLARRLQAGGHYAEAARRYAEVPDGDAMAPLARYFRMLALKQVLDDAATSGKGQAAGADELLGLAQTVSAETKARIARGGGTRDDTLILTGTNLIAAGVALGQKGDPKTALAMLEGFEASAAALPNARRLDEQAMTLRVRALMDLGRNREATDALVKVLEESGGAADGARIAYELLAKLNDQFDAAKKAGNKEAMLSLARSRASLSGFLVPWAEKNASEKIRADAWQYRWMDAETKRQAAELEPDPAERARQLQATLELFRALQKGLPQPEAKLDLDVALVQYDLGQYEEAQAALGLLLQERRLGRATIEEEQNGALTVRPNDRYWEATLKLFRSTVKLVEAGKAPASAKQNIVDGLQSDFARWGRELGGPKWSGEFEKLRQEIAPDYAVPEIR